MGTIRVRVGAHCEETSLPIQIPKGINTNSAQDMIAATTYLRRILFCMALDIQVTDDLDDDGASLDEFVTTEELAGLKELITKTGTDEARFLKWGLCESLDKLPRSKFAAAVSMLGKKVNK
jgi:hypothetical protein